MRTRQVLPYLVALLLLAWILGTLSRSGTGGASILSNSYWLLYILYLLPIFALVAMVALTVFLIFNWKLLSDAMGFRIAARKRAARKQNNTVRLLVWITFWTIAIATLLWKCGGIFCQNTNSTQTVRQVIVSAVDGSPNPKFPSLPGLSGPILALTNIVSSQWFSLAFFGLLVVSTVIIARSILVSFDETRQGRFLPARVKEEGTMAVENALRTLALVDVADPRTRIIACYERMINAAASLGANISVDQTARELEAGIRRLFQLKGPGIADLTRLFEEARYSLHPIDESESEEAQQCMLEIGKELEVSQPITVEN